MSPGLLALALALGPVRAGDGPEVSVAVGVWPSTLALDARLHWPLVEAVDAGVVAALGPLFVPVPVTLRPYEGAEYTALELDGRAGVYLRHRWWLGHHGALTPGVEGVVRLSWQYLSVQEPEYDVAREAALLARWLEARPSLRAEWRPGHTLGIGWLEPLGVEGRVETVIGGIYAAYNEFWVNGSLRWTFREGRSGPPDR